MNKVIRYGLYEAKIYFRIKTAVFYSIFFPIILLLMYYVGNSGSSAINEYFPYLVSITMISTAAGLSNLIVNNRVYNMWKFYNFFGYKTWQMTVATGIIYFVLSEVICLGMTGIMILVLHTLRISILNFILFMLATGLGTVLYIEIAIIIGLWINDPRNAQTIINGFIYLFVILSGSIFRFARGSIMGKVMLVFPNIHIGNLLHQLWNNCKISMCGLEIVAGYIIILLCIIIYLIKRERKKLLY